MKKNCAFELYRFLFSAVILAFHGRYNWNITSDKSFGAGFLAVEFFFLLSGFLMMQHQEENTDTQSSAEDQAVRYLVHRFRRLFPLYAVSLVGAMLLRWYVYGKPITVTYLFREMPEFFMLQVFWAPMKINGALWFISAMLWAGFLVYYLVLKNKAFFTRIFFPLGLLLFCSLASVKAGHIDIVNNVYYFWLGGFLRAFFEIGFGCSLYQIYIYIYIYGKATSLHKIPATILEIGLSAAVFYGMLCKTKGDGDFIMVFIISALILVLAARKGYLSKLLDNKISAYLGKISYPIFLLHVPLLSLAANRVLSGWSYLPAMAVVLLQCVVLAMGLTYLNEHIAAWYSGRRKEK